MKKRSVLWAAFIVFCMALSFFIAQSSAQEKTLSKLVLSVEGENGDAKQGVRVQIEGPSKYLRATDNNGNLYFKDFVVGKYSITVRQGRIHENKFEIEIKSSPQKLVVDW